MLNKYIAKVETCQKERKKDLRAIFETSSSYGKSQNNVSGYSSACVVKIG